MVMKGDLSISSIRWSGSLVVLNRADGTACARLHVGFSEDPPHYSPKARSEEASGISDEIQSCRVTSSSVAFLFKPGLDHGLKNLPSRQIHREDFQTNTSR